MRVCQVYFLFIYEEKILKDRLKGDDFWSNLQFFFIRWVYPLPYLVSIMWDGLVNQISVNKADLMNQDPYKQVGFFFLSVQETALAIRFSRSSGYDHGYIVLISLVDNILVFD